MLSSRHFLALVILRLEILLKIVSDARQTRGGLETDQSSGFQQQHRGCLLGKNEALFRGAWGASRAHFFTAAKVCL